ncbi:MAG TPA: hypothetical protein VHE35_09900 [Kofleriaceae bacterium]|nr:hypothetical protein [Kofleriaceae bacterium]
MTFQIARSIALPWLLAAGACVHAAAVRPHDMSVGQHDAAATEEDRRAETADPTEADPHWAEQHRRLAAEHRAAAQTLRDAEARACAGLSLDDRDLSPLAHPVDVSGVRRFREDVRFGRSATTRDAGATIFLAATPGLTVEWLQRIVDCHLARSAAVGHDRRDMLDCPLTLRGAQATVRSVRAGFAVDVRADDPAAASEIWRRAQRLVTPR